MNPVTKAHRLSVARAWYGADTLTEFLQAYVDDDRGPHMGAPSVVAMLERLAQLVADAEGAWIPREEGGALERLRALELALWQRTEGEAQAGNVSREVIWEEAAHMVAAAVADVAKLLAAPKPPEQP